MSPISAGSCKLSVVFLIPEDILKKIVSIFTHLNPKILLIMESVIIFSLLKKRNKTPVEEPYQSNFQNIVIDINGCQTIVEVRFNTPPIFVP